MGAQPLPEGANEAPVAPSSEWPPITTAFQPIVELATGRVVAYEALVRSAGDTAAAGVIEGISRQLRLRFDQHCREVAIEAAARLDRNVALSLNVRYFDAASCLDAVQRTLAHAQGVGLAGSHLTFEITEIAQVIDPARLASALRDRTRPWRMLLDSFVAGPAGVALLEKLRPDGVKLDRSLVHGIADREANRAIVRWAVSTAKRLRVQVIAKGVERPQDLDVLASMGIGHFQGYLFAPPAVDRLPAPMLPPGRRTFG